MQSGIRTGLGLGFGALKNLIRQTGGARQARQLIESVRQNLPILEMTGVPAIQATARRAAVRTGLTDELTAFPSAVSREGGNLGLMGTRSVPTARQLGQAPVPQFGPGAGTPRPPAGSRPTNTLVPQPMQGPRQRGGPLVRTAQDNVPAPAARTQFTEDLISQPVVQGPLRPPVQGPSMTGTPVQGRLDLRFPAGSRSAAEFTTAKGAVRPEGTAIGGQPYRGGPVATERNLETIRLNQAQPEIPRSAGVPEGQQSIFTSKLPDIFSGEYNIRPELLRQLPREVQERIGTVMMREAADLGPVAPRPAFGAGAGPAPVDPTVTAAFALNAARGADLVDPAIVAAIVNNAASGAKLVDLKALMSNPAVWAGLGAGGLGLAGVTVANMLSGDRTGETTAGSPPTLPPAQPPVAPLFRGEDGLPLEAPAPGPSALAAPPAPGNIDPSIAAPTVTAGNLQQGSATREALAQFAPGAAAVRRAVEPMSPEKYRNIEDYYAARAAYAGSADKQQELMKYMEGQSSTIGSELSSWAQSYPALAYEYQLRQRQLVNSAANQQGVGSITGRKVVAPIGSDDNASAVGHGEAVASAIVDGTPGARDLAAVTAPMPLPYLQRMSPRSAMYAGY